MKLFTTAKISPVGKVNANDLKKWGMNILVFSAPVLIVFFGQLAKGVPVQEAWPITLIALYGALVDLFRKFSSGK
mgnify:CR=1 FL=1